MSAKLNSKSVGKTRLPGRTWTGDHNKFDIYSVKNFLGNVSNPALLKSFLHQDHLVDPALADHIVKVTNVVDSHHVAPFT